MKAWMVCQVGVFALLVGINNVSDYGSNFAFVQHVLSMDTTFEGNRLMWRSIGNSTVHHLVYALIILTELVCGLVCLYAAFCMWQRRKDHVGFARARAMAALGLTIGITLWFSGFMTVGAEWFLMWQSEIWNGQAAASRFIAMLFFVLLFLYVPEDKTC